MKFKLEIDCDNAAFSDEHEPFDRSTPTGVPPRRAEIARILNALALGVEEAHDHGSIKFVLMDINGNRVGTAEEIP